MGLVALWREGLLAQKVLAGKTKGYTQHPQLLRFKSTDAPLAYISLYLSEVCDEATARNYQFNRAKILKSPDKDLPALILNRGQLQYEVQHLKKKLEARDPEKARTLNNTGRVQPHPLFKVVAGDVTSWEIR